MKRVDGKDIPDMFEEGLNRIRWYDTLEIAIEKAAKYLIENDEFPTVVIDRKKKRYAVETDFAALEGAAMSGCEIRANCEEMLKYAEAHNMEYHPILEVARKMGYKK